MMQWRGQAGGGFQKELTWRGLWREGSGVGRRVGRGVASGAGLLAFD